MNTRRTLPQRRQHETFEFKLEGIRYVASAGRFSDGTIAEIFFHSAGKPGSTAERMAQDAAVVASLALQHGASMSVIHHSLVKLRDGRAAGPLGRFLELLADGDRHATPQ